MDKKLVSFLVDSIEHLIEMKILENETDEWASTNVLIKNSIQKKKELIIEDITRILSSND